MKKHVSPDSYPRAGGNTSKMCWPKTGSKTPKDTSDGVSQKEGYKVVRVTETSPQARPLVK